MWFLCVLFLGCIEHSFVSMHGNFCLSLLHSLKLSLPRSPMSFYSCVHYIVYHFSYIWSSKQCLKNVERFPSWYPNLLIIFFSISLANPTQNPLWMALSPYWYFFYLATLPFSLIILSDLHCLLLLQLPFRYWWPFQTSLLNSRYTYPVVYYTFPLGCFETSSSNSASITLSTLSSH